MKEAARALLALVGAPRSMISVWEWYGSHEPMLVVRLAPSVWQLRDRVPMNIGGYTTKVELRDIAISQKIVDA